MSVSVALATSTAAADDTPWSVADDEATGPSALVCSVAPAALPTSTSYAHPAASFLAPVREAVAMDLDAGDGAAALARYRAHLEAGDLASAAVALESARVAAPGLADRFALLRADLEMRMGPTRETCPHYDAALESPLPSIAARARVGRVHCLLVTDARDAEEELAALTRRYRDLPERRQLDLEHAAWLARHGSVREAVLAYDRIDRDDPGTPEAADARDALDELAAQGHPRPAMTTAAEVDRLERLARSGPPEMARAEAERLHALSLDRPSASRVTLVLARLARLEGRFEDAAALIAEARGLDPTVGEDPDAVAAQQVDLAAVARGRVVEQARSDLRRLGWSGGPLRRTNSVRLVSMLRIAARAGMQEESTTLANELASRETALCTTRFDAAILASGTASDESVVALLDPCAGESSTREIASRYHRARALERLGRIDDACEELEAVAACDRDDARIYAVLAEARLEAARHRTVRDPLAVPADDDAKEDDETAAPSPTPFDALAALAELGPRHPELPWLARAHDELALGDATAASEELFTAYSAWAEALGRSPLRAGVEAVYRNASAPRVPTTMELRRARRALSDEDRVTLANVADALGEAGLAMRFDPSRVSRHPRPYEEAVQASAARHGLDPNLLFAVMRVESVYNPRIVSYAGAIGLLQIMPRTGRLIAHSMGNDDFDVADLLDPATNIEMAAWYLSSLIARFEGRLPLAIAAYNGGPHNVRRWIADHGSAMPIDALCEEIPFEQTHRYVRRVLSHYAAYRAEAGLPPATLDLDLPALGPDTTAF
ncbi:MAG: lytic transglycosylase domain-containing protein [Sandaracinus sp.]